MSRPVCICPKHRLCDGCLLQMVMWHGGIASSRGVAWAQRIAREHPELLVHPWPPLAGRAAQKTLSKVADLGHQDPRLIRQLVEEVAESAARRWEELRAKRG